MDLFLPESGLVIWMLVAFLVVFFILAKFAWPVIMDSVTTRNDHIAQSLKAAEEAKSALAGIEQERKKIEAEARSEQIRILKESQELKTQMVEEAKQQARAEAEKIVAEARTQIAKEQQEAMAQVKNEVITLSVSIAEKILQRELSKDSAQDLYIELLLNNRNQAEA